MFTVRLLGRLLPPSTAALAGTLLYGGAAPALVSAAVAEWRRVGPLWPDATLASIREDVRAARPAAH